MVNQLNNQEILVNQQFLTSFNVKVDDSFPINGSEYKILGTFGAVGGTDIYSKNIPLVLFSGLQNDPYLNSRILIKLSLNLRNVPNVITYLNKNYLFLSSNFSNLNKFIFGM